MSDRYLRILAMCDAPADANSGMAGTEVQTIAALRRIGHEVEEVWARDLSHKIAHGNLHYLIELPWSMRKVMSGRMQSRPYDVIHVNQPHGHLAAKHLRRSGSKAVFVHRSHGFELLAFRALQPWMVRYNCDRRSVLRRVASRFMWVLVSKNAREITRWADGHVVYASDCARFLVDEMNVPVDRVAVVAPAAPPAFLETAAPLMSQERQRRVIHLGQFAFFKAPMVVAEVMNDLSTDDGIALTWVCERQHHADVTRLLTERARRRVQLLDWMSQEALIDAYDANGIFLFPSFYEGFGKVFLEAMTRGMCVVASESAGPRDVIRPGTNGVLVPIGDAGAMAAACRTLIRDFELATSMSRAAAEASRRYTWDCAAAEIATFYRHLVAVREAER